MLDKHSAETWYKKIEDNHRSGNCEQRILGLRLFFDGILSAQVKTSADGDFYVNAINNIASRGFNPNASNIDISKAKIEFHKLRKYFNRIQHSIICADENGYISAVKRMAVLVNFCSNQPIPTYINSITTGNKRLSTQIESTQHASTPQINGKESPSLLFVLNKDSFTNIEILASLDSELSKRRDDFVKLTQFAGVYSISKSSAKLTNLAKQTSSLFSLQSPSPGDLVKPISQFLTNNNIGTYAPLFIVYLSSDNSVDIQILETLDKNIIHDNIHLFTIAIIDDKRVVPNLNSCEIHKYHIAIDKISSMFEWLKNVIKEN